MEDLIVINQLFNSARVIPIPCFVFVPADEHRPAGIPGNRRCFAAEGRRASHAQHWSHSALWQLAEKEENLPEQNAHRRGGQTHRSVCFRLHFREWITNVVFKYPFSSPQACPCTTPRCESHWTTSWDTWTRRWAAAWCSPVSRCSTKNQRTWSRAWFPAAICTSCHASQRSCNFQRLKGWMFFLLSLTVVKGNLKSTCSGRVWLPSPASCQTPCQNRSSSTCCHGQSLADSPHWDFFIEFLSCILIFWHNIF